MNTNFDKCIEKPLKWSNYVKLGINFMKKILNSLKNFQIMQKNEKNDVSHIFYLAILGTPGLPTTMLCILSKASLSLFPKHRCRTSAPTTTMLSLKDF